MLSIGTISAHGQVTNDAHKKLTAAFQSIKDMEQCSYRYTMDMSFPDSTKEQLVGKVFLDNKANVLYQENKAFTLLYTGKWFYKANHLDKQVTVIDVTKYLDEDSRKENVQDLFGGRLSSDLIDSVVLKHGSLDTFYQKGAVQHFVLNYDERGFGIRSVQLDFNEQTKLPVSLIVSTYYPYPNSVMGYTQIIKCDRYSRKEKEPSLSSYFMVNNGKAVLKRYQNYKLNSLL